MNQFKGSNVPLMLTTTNIFSLWFKVTLKKLRTHWHLLLRRQIPSIGPTPWWLSNDSTKGCLLHKDLSSQHWYGFDDLDNLGRICLDILKKNWSPALQIKSVLLSIQSLLAEPNPEDPLNNEAADHWKTNKTQAEQKARESTNKYAKWFFK